MKSVLIQLFGQISIFASMYFEGVSQNFEYMTDGISINVSVKQGYKDSLKNVSLCVQNLSNTELMVLSEKCYNAWVENSVMFVELKTRITDPLLLPNYKIDLICLKPNSGYCFIKNDLPTNLSFKEVRVYIDTMMCEFRSRKKSKRTKNRNFSVNKLIPLKKLLDEDGDFLFREISFSIFNK